MKNLQLSLYEAFWFFEKRGSMEILKANRTQLSDEERAKVMAAGAVWHHGPNGEATPAVWKSKDSAGNVKYVCNTHRAGAVKDTLADAIKAFDFIKTTS